ncbi:uncharacterized protein LOC108840832 [Raphanus sativus]|uniref:Uncharacterized protein LOC108840832 n=1 Tax=Raphanus sativus TaxID=3726 RepID=A0A9W3BVZ9_RAPSA|nr:uncharacterized protein LOC108840832 [Raphanus sativus]
MRGTTVKVNCYHSGKFKTEDGKLIYANGEVEVLEVDGVSIFEDVVFQMVHKTELGEMWYKLPYEDLEDRKSLSANIDQGKKQLKTGGCWMKEVDFYIEKIGEDERINEEEVNVEQENVVLEVEERMIDQVANEEERIIEQGEHENETNIVNEEAGEHGFEEDGDDADYEESEEESWSDLRATDDESDENDEAAEEDIDVINNNNYDDEIPDEDEVYPDTEASSDEEEEQAERMARAGLLDGVLSLRQTFSSGEEFKKQVISYILQTRRNVVYDRWEKTKIGARCNGKGCLWRIYCSVEKPLNRWMVKVYENKHTCHPTGRCKTIKAPVIADLMLEAMRRNPDMSGPMIQEEMRNRYNIIITVPQSQNARRMALDKLQAECNEQFSRLRDYVVELKRSNIGTVTEINTTRNIKGGHVFSSFYVCFDSLRIAWKQNCRPIIGLDGTFLKHSLQGMLLTAIGRDPNNQVFPIAWGVVSGESNDNWQWFIHRLKEDLELGLGEQTTIISDMHRGLIHGVAVELPRAEHRACARHVYSNLKKNHKSDMLKPLFWRIASSYNEPDYELNLKIFRDYDSRACEELLKKDHRTWCRAFFRAGACCSDTHNNLTESFNRTLKIARKKPFVQMMELIRRDAMKRIAIRFKTADKEVGTYTPKARKEIAKACDEAKNCYSVSSTDGEFEIVQNLNGYAVKMNLRTCACRKWDLTGIPCCHAVCAIRENAPPYKRPPGRPKGKARIKGVNESPKKGKKHPETKVSRKGREMHCSLCGNKGHNSRKCPHESEENRVKRRRIQEGLPSEEALAREEAQTSHPVSDD